MTDRAKTGAVSAAPEVRFYLAAEPLRAFVTSYYVLDVPGPLVDFTHPEWGNIRFALTGKWQFGEPGGSEMQTPAGAALFGPTDRTWRFAGEGGVVLGIGLTPIGWLRLIGSDAAQAANTIVPLGSELGVAGEEIHRQLIEAPDELARVAILDSILLARRPNPSGYYDLAVRVQQTLLSGDVDQVGEFAELLGVEQRTLHRVCRSIFGFSPVRLLRRQRFLRTLGKVRDALDQPVGQLIDSHYYDQAHFNRDFRAYMGMSPLAYFRLPREALRRAAEERRRVLGAPVQGLHGQKG